MSMPAPLKLDTLVELQDQYSDVYPASVTGARGWVRARRELPKVDPEVYIEWDQHHWRYHGETNGWTFEHHFRPVDDAAPLDTDYPSLPEMLADAQRKVDSERCEHCGAFHDYKDAFIDTLAEAQDSASGSDGYFIMTVTPRQEGDTILYEPAFFSQALTPDVRRMLEAQIVHVATQLFTNHLASEISSIEGPPDEPGW